LKLIDHRSKNEAYDDAHQNQTENYENEILPVREELFHRVFPEKRK